MSQFHYVACCLTLFALIKLMSPLRSTMTAGFPFTRMPKTCDAYAPSVRGECRQNFRGNRTTPAVRTVIRRVRAAWLTEIRRSIELL
jgi:hypothetical protein